MVRRRGRESGQRHAGVPAAHAAAGRSDRKPRRLLYRPTDKQLAQELIYSASRNFVFGAADLKIRGQSMQRFMEASGAVDADDPQLEVIRRNLIDGGYERRRNR